MFLQFQFYDTSLTTKAQVKISASNPRNRLKRSASLQMRIFEVEAA
jgi:hypothetical protein